LRKRVETNSLRLEAVKAAAKEGWQEEADRIIGMIEKDQVTIAAQLNRRVFIRLW
jgi:sorting nexin-8